MKIFVFSIILLFTFIPIAFVFDDSSHTNADKGKQITNLDDRSQTFGLDSVVPSINVTFPPYPPTITTGAFTIEGTANDHSGSGIKTVNAIAHSFPYNNKSSLIPSSKPLISYDGNLYKWSIPFMFNQSEVYRIVVEVRDGLNNIDYAETTVNVVLLSNILYTSDSSISYNETATTRNTNIPNGKDNGKEDLRIEANDNDVRNSPPIIAFVRPTFTESAYQVHGFYDFYYKYKFPPFGQNITTDIDMLTVKTPGSVTDNRNISDLRQLTNITALIPMDKDSRFFWIPFVDHLKKGVPDGLVTIMRDEDVDDGHIFGPNNKTNVYDALVMFHNEYVTLQEYNNLKQFVKNGGNLLFIDSNIFYAEISYDKDNHQITLVKGHDWEFDGNVAKRGPSERWYNESREWIGSNFLVSDISTNITFANNVFNYTHFEEQFMNNPNNDVIIDYDVRFPKDYLDLEDQLPIKSVEDIDVATYKLNYGKGKVIMMGIYGQNLADNEKFLKFFDNVIVPELLCPKFQPC
jgi:hypothetical protein